MTTCELQGSPPACRNPDDDDVIEMEEIKQTDEGICKSFGGSPSGRWGFPISKSRRNEQLISLIEKELLMSKRRVTVGVSTIEHRESRSLPHDPVFKRSLPGLCYDVHGVLSFSEGNGGWITCRTAPRHVLSFPWPTLRSADRSGASTPPVGPQSEHSPSEQDCTRPGKDEEQRPSTRGS